MKFLCDPLVNDVSISAWKREQLTLIGFLNCNFNHLT